MRVELGLARHTKTKDAKLSLIRKATTRATGGRWNGNRLKKSPPKSVTLPKVKCLEESGDG